MKKLIIITFVLVAAGLIFVFTDEDTDSQQQTPPDQEEVLGRVPQDVTDTIAGNVMLGFLQISDNQDFGNLMLIADDETKKYIQTSRDFTEFLDQEVVMEFSGTSDNFILINIHPKN